MSKQYIPSDASQPGRPPIVHEDIGVEGASLHWIGPKKAENVMLFFHGGGYVLPAVEGHFALVDHWRKEVKKRYGISMSVAVLEYSLSNHAPWPTQLVQTIASLNHLLKEGYDPSNIILAGDSVGGHQVNFVLAHLMHPHPNAPEIKLSKPLAGAAMLSPWLCYAQTAPSFTRNAKSDLLPVETLHAWSEQIVQTRQTTDDGYFFEPAYSPPEWWAGLGNVVRSVLFTTGSNECMFDDIVATAHRMEKGAGSDAKLECFVQHGASHNEALVEMACGDAPGPTSERVTTWIDSVLK
ncbi:hypothetical protein CERSUDRAFT_121308 [Gelatoporia subvermispora B]|uniref:Alpha/beta hydrolase fold-3 domain-containing protein n=1 Tax=Ceriporiopsis subvermispora (strain B) TaxID=914234 RepID=M2PUZ8_CERS8|nr:hypothetical protein CERSUDRAFT_121308 [Gelatoporia subvermispora B]